MVKSADRVCNILRLVCPRKNGLRHAEIARTLDIPSSSLSGLLASLLEEQFLSLNALTQRYSLGPQILSLAGSYLDGLDVVEHSKPVKLSLSGRLFSTSSERSLSLWSSQLPSIVSREKKRRSFNMP